MKTFVLAAAVALFVSPASGLGAEKTAPAPVLAAPARPFISDLAPRRVHVQGILTVLGGNFGKDTPSRPLRMRMGGNGFGAELEVRRWTDTSVEVVLPKGASPGRYYVGVADARAQWVSRIDQTFEILPDLRDVAVSLDVTFRCLFDVLAAPPAILVTLLSPGAVARTTLTATGQTPGPFGNRIHHFTGRMSVRPGSYTAVTDGAAHFTLDVWDNPSTHWLTPQCADHKRTTDSGAPLPTPVRQSRSVFFDSGAVTVTDDTTSLPLRMTVLIELGSLAPPSPVCPPAGCT